MDADFIKQAIFSLIRYTAAPIVAWISLNFGITEDQTTAFLVGGITYAVMFVWSLANKWRAEDKVAVALELPGGSSKSTLNDVLKNK